LTATETAQSQLMSSLVHVTSKFVHNIYIICEVNNLKFQHYLFILERPFVKRFALCYRTVVCLSVLSVTLVYCGQTVGWIKMPLGVEVGLSPGHIMLDQDPAAPRKKWSSKRRLPSVFDFPNFHCLYASMGNLRHRAKLHGDLSNVAEIR